MKRILWVLVILMPGFACQTDTQMSNKVRVATSIFPIYDLIHQVAQETIDLQYIIPAGANPHGFEPTPSQVSFLRSTNYFIGVHPEFDGWIESFLPKTGRTTYLISTLAGSENMEDHHSNAHDDPHVWLSIRETKSLIGKIAMTLSEYQPEQQKKYARNALAYEIRLDSLDQVVTKRFSSIKYRKIIQWHQAWDRFADDYGLTIISTVEAGHDLEISLKAFQRIVQKAKQDQVRIVVIGQNQESPAAVSLARAINGQLISLDILGNPYDPAHNSYLKFMAYNADRLADALEVP